jgi:hypothetical protein
MSLSMCKKIASIQSEIAAQTAGIDSELHKLDRIVCPVLTIENGVITGLSYPAWYVSRCKALEDLRETVVRSILQSREMDLLAIQS